MMTDNITKSRILFWLLISFTISNILDFVTAMFILPAESNPIYVLTKSIWLIAILKCVVVCIAWFIYYKNHFPGRLSSFSFVYILIIGTFMIMVGVLSNTAGIMNNELVDIGAEVTDKEKIVYYFNIVGYLMMLPYILSMVSFYIHEKISSKLRYSTR